MSSSPAAAGLVAFLNESVTAYHAVESLTRQLEADGFEKLNERLTWDVKPGKAYFVTRNKSAVLAFTVGGSYKPGNGFTITGAHTDSPCLRLKPVSSLTKAGGVLSVGVETYGGGLWYTWLDRDLSVAGRVIVEAAPGRYESRLVRIARPILRIPSLAIHLQRDVNSEGLKLNAETHLPPLLCTAVKARLEEDAASTAATGGEGGAASAAVGVGVVGPAGTGPALTRHHPPLIRLLAAELGVSPAAVADFDLCLYDTQPATLGGLYNEFVFGGRLDNLAMTHTTFAGLSSAVKSGLHAASDRVWLAAAFDHEEVGSSSVPGAGSTFLEDIVRRLCPDPALVPLAMRASFLVSADMAHAQHPNYGGLHEDAHRPLLGGGLVIKSNANQRYATTPATAFLFRRIAAGLGVPLQAFVVRQDMGCGSTIGPIIATRLGLRTVDIGIPQLSMHSVREMCAAEDVGTAVRFFSGFFDAFGPADAALTGAE